MRLFVLLYCLGSCAASAGEPPVAPTVVAIDSAAIDGLRAYSDALKRYSPGATLHVGYQRGGAESRAAIILAGR